MYFIKSKYLLLYFIRDRDRDRVYYRIDRDRIEKI